MILESNCLSSASLLSFSLLLPWNPNCSKRDPCSASWSPTTFNIVICFFQTSTHFVTISLKYSTCHQFLEFGTRTHTPRLPSFHSMSILPCLFDLYRLMDYGHIFDSFGQSLIWYSCKMSSSIREERNRRRSYLVYSRILHAALPSACLEACILQIFLGTSQALCALLLLLLLLPPLLECSLPPKLYRKITRIICE